MNFFSRVWGRVSGKTARLHFETAVRLRTKVAALSQVNKIQKQTISSLRQQLGGLSNGTGLPNYVDFIPENENSLKLFSGSWSSKFPNLDGPGNAGLFEDPRIQWLIEECGDITNWQVLELGPLEGGHTYMLENAGAKVTSIEGNTQAFVRSLIAKNFTGLNAHYLLGDFTKSFGPPKDWDLIVASGVLYHMLEPGRLLEKMSESSDRLFLWTHYFEPDLTLWSPNWQKRLESKWHQSEEYIVEIAGVKARHVPYSYNEALGWSGFCGGPASQATWLYRDDIQLIMRNLGFKQFKYAFDDPAHPNGPAFCLFATK